MLLSNFERGVLGLVTGAVYPAVLRDDLDEAVINGVGLVLRNLVITQCLCDTRLGRAGLLVYQDQELHEGCHAVIQAKAIAVNREITWVVVMCNDQVHGLSIACREGPVFWEASKNSRTQGVVGDAVVILRGERSALLLGFHATVG